MKTKKYQDQENNRVETSIFVFMDLYNSRIPANFPTATIRTLRKFQEHHPSLFKASGDGWSIDRHRKRYMDWLSSVSIKA